MRKREYDKEIMALMKKCKFLSKDTITKYLSKSDRKFNRLIHKELSQLVETRKLYKHHVYYQEFGIVSSKAYYGLKAEIHQKRHWALVEIVVSYKLLQGCDVHVEPHTDELSGFCRPDIIAKEKDGNISYYEVENDIKKKYEQVIVSKVSEYKQGNIMKNLKIVCSSEKCMDLIRNYLKSNFDEPIAGISVVSRYRNVVKLN